MSEFERNFDKIVHMPPREEILQRLQEAGLYGITPQSDLFYDRFVDKIADSKKVGEGLVLAWTLAAYDTLREYPPMIGVLVDMNFGRAIDAITPDPDVAEAARAFRGQVQEEAARKRNQP